jgi:O-antigen ligase
MLAAGAPALVVVASPAVAYLLLRQERPALLAAAMISALLIAHRPTMVLPVLIPVGLLGAVLPGASFAVPAAAIVLLLATALRVVAGTRPLRVSHLVIGTLAGLLLASYLVPPITIGGERPRLSDLMGLVVGLGLLAVAVTSPPHPRKLTRVIAVAGAVTAGYTLVGAAHESGRLEGLGLNPNYLGALLALSLVAAAGLLRQGRHPMWLVPGGICLIAMTQTQSRGAFLAAAAGIGVVLLQGRSVKLQAAAVVITVAALAALPNGIESAEHLAAGSRQSTELSANSDVRRHAAQFAAQVAVAHPLRGIGYGMFPAYAARSPHFGIYINTHNDYLRLAAETGAVALAAFLVLLCLGIAGRRSGDLTTLRAVVVTYAVALMFANLLANLATSLPFWLSLGCLLAAVPNARRSGHVSDTPSDTPSAASRHQGPSPRPSPRPSPGRLIHDV